ncbi:uncharacterized protein LOC110727242 [Chenopodium quinoa]|uniref:uncharacterized protein LOC110727242 n=1 Tax=Chenopodium quinoa TaxID=63459 RepID=UPI000B78884F|nr:uncharacterized protein LOC110727242 [Chenopodium quinoa]
MAGGSGKNNDGGELSEVGRQLAAVAQQLARNSTNNGDAQGELFKKVAQSKPPTYQGEVDPTVLENWLREFERLFGAVGYPEVRKWVVLPIISEIRDKFYPRLLRKQKAEEFSSLAMGVMSITEYYTKFIERSQFAQESVSTEKAKARKFETGLTTDLQLKLCGHVFETLDEVYGRAAHLYALELKNKKELGEVEGKEKRKEKREIRWGKVLETRMDCEGNLVTCRACNKLGHREYECFSKNPNRNKQGNNQRGAQRNFQGNYNYSGNKRAQQNGAKGNNNGNYQVKSGAPGKLNVMSRHKADSTKDVITGTFSINSILVKVLFDSGATFSFISKVIVSNLSHCLNTGGVVQCTKTFRDVPLKIKGKVFLSDLIEFGLSDFDIILGMDWLSKYSA